MGICATTSLFYVKTTEEKAATHNKELKEKWTGENKIRRRSSEVVPSASSKNSNIQRAIVARKPTKPEFSKAWKMKTQIKAPRIRTHHNLQWQNPWGMRLFRKYLPQKETSKYP